jgi:hypothetical protein
MAAATESIAVAFEREVAFGRDTTIEPTRCCTNFLSLSSSSFFTTKNCAMSVDVVGAAHCEKSPKSTVLGNPQVVPPLDSEVMWRGRGGVACVACATEREGEERSNDGEDKQRTTVG